MTDTSMTLLNRLQQTGDPETWRQLVDLYSPLLTRWLQKYDVQTSDSDDLVQEVLMAVSQDLTKFNHNGRPGAFRAWLRSILVFRLRNFWRKRERRPMTPGDSDLEHRLSQLDDPASEMSQLWNQQHDQHVAQRLLAICRQHFEADT
jgi:RNA polymerase sigma factor (sigma-70 family)